MFISTDNTYVEVLDNAGAGGANHEYEVKKLSCDISELPDGCDIGISSDDKTLCKISFQNGPIKENGVNGIQNEDLLNIVKNRLEGFQSGGFSCIENQIALNSVNSALEILKYRTKERKIRNVEGLNIK